MREAGREEPEIVLFDVLHECIACSIEARQTRLAAQHERPFGSRVPVQFAASARDQTHVHPGDVLGNGEIRDRDLSAPAAFLDAPVGHGK